MILVVKNPRCASPNRARSIFYYSKKVGIDQVVPNEVTWLLTPSYLDVGTYVDISTVVLMIQQVGQYNSILVARIVY